MPDLVDVLDQLAEQIAKDLQGAKVSIDQKIEAFKVLSGYHSTMAKLKPPPDGEDGGTPNFDAMRRRIQKAS